MGASAKKALKKELNKIPSSTPLTDKQKSSSGFLGGPGRKLLESTGLKNKSGVLYIGRIPHGFYEEEMKCGRSCSCCLSISCKFEHLLQVYVIPREHVYPKLWKGFDYCYNPVCRLQIERKQQNQVGDVQSVPDKIKFNLRIGFPELTEKC